MPNNTVLVSDAARVYAWMADPEAVRPAAQQWGGLGQELNGRMVAGALWSECTSTDVRVHLRVEVPTRGFLISVLRTMFHGYGFRRITMPVFDDNTRCLRLVRHLGAELECVVRHGHSGGDVHQYVLWRNTGIHRRLLDKGVLS